MDEMIKLLEERKKVRLAERQLKSEQTYRHSGDAESSEEEEYEYEYESESESEHDSEYKSNDADDDRVDDNEEIVVLSMKYNNAKGELYDIRKTRGEYKNMKFDLVTFGSRRERIFQKLALYETIIETDRKVAQAKEAKLAAKVQQLEADLATAQRSQLSAALPADKDELRRITYTLMENLSDKLELKLTTAKAAQAGAGAGYLVSSTPESEIIDREMEGQPHCHVPGKTAEAALSGAMASLLIRGSGTLGDTFRKVTDGKFPRLAKDKQRRALSVFANTLGDELLRKLQERDEDRRATHTGFTVFVPTVPLVGLDASTISRLILQGKHSPDGNSFGPAQPMKDIAGHSLTVGLPSNDRRIVRIGVDAGYVDFAVQSEHKFANGVLLFVEPRTDRSLKDVFGGADHEVKAAEAQSPASRRSSAAGESGPDIDIEAVPADVSSEAESADADPDPVGGSDAEAESESESEQEVSDVGVSDPIATFQKRFEDAVDAAVASMKTSIDDSQSEDAVKQVHTLLSSTSRATIRATPADVRAELFARLKAEYEDLRHDAPHTEDLMSEAHEKLFP